MFSRHQWIKENKENLILEPSGRKYSGLHCPHSNNICSLENCMFYDINNQNCSLIIYNKNDIRKPIIDFEDEIERVIQSRKIKNNYNIIKH